MVCCLCFFFQAEDGIRDAQESRGLGDVYKRQRMGRDTLDILRIFNNQSFNPRARMGRDAGLSSESPEDSPFQSTRPHGARQISQGGYYIFNCFNPRARMGRDTGSNKKIIVAHVSIHAPAWGATWLQFTADVVAVFQSTRPHGARQQLFSHRPCQSRTLVILCAPCHIV